MTDIRVNPGSLREAASELEAVADRLRALADEALQSASGSPSYGGQFQPRVKSMGLQAHARLRSQADRFSALSEDLAARATAFEQADLESQAAFASLGASYPAASIRIPTGFPIIPDWIWELLIGFLPFGDLYDIGKELIRLITQGELDELVLALAALGLIADIGWLDGPIPDPVDGANGGLALLKTLVKQIPPGPARDAIKEAVEGMIRNADEAPRFFEALFGLLKHDEIFTALKENHRALAAVIEAGPEVIEQLAKNEDAALALLKHQDVAISLIKRAEYLDVLIQGGPEAVEQLLKYGDDFAARFIDEIPGNGLADIDLLQGIEVSRRAQDLGTEIHIAGRWADTAEEAALRADAFREASRLADDYVLEGMPREEAFRRAQVEIGEAFGIDPYQVKISSGGSELDVFIPADQWQALSIEQRNALTDELSEIFDVAEIDMYQELSAIPGYPDPATNIPPGSISFSPEGGIGHTLLGNLDSP